MTKLEKNEIAIIVLVGVLVLIFSARLPSELAGGQFVLAISILTFIQSLVRDLWLLRISRKRADSTPKKHAQCMCVESTVGVTALLLAFILLGTGMAPPVAMQEWKWPIYTLAVLVFGFFTKDLVLEWNPWRIRRDPDHLNIVVQWRKPKA